MNNAGIGPISPLDDLRVEEWEEMIDINIKGVLYGIAAALPVFRKQGFGHFINIASTAGHKTVANQSVYSATKFAVRAISEGLRQEAGEHLRVTIISPGFVQTEFVDAIADQHLRAQLVLARDKMAMPPEAIARSIAFAIEQPAGVGCGRNGRPSHGAGLGAALRCSTAVPANEFRRLLPTDGSHVGLFLLAGSDGQSLTCYPDDPSAQAELAAATHASCLALGFSHLCHLLEHELGVAFALLRSSGAPIDVST